MVQQYKRSVEPTMSAGNTVIESAKQRHLHTIDVSKEFVADKNDREKVVLIEANVKAGKPLASIASDIAALDKKYPSMTLRNKNGDTVLHVAIRKGYVDVIPLMIPLKNVQNNDGKTAIDIAEDMMNDMTMNRGKYTAEQVKANEEIRKILNVSMKELVGVIKKILFENTAYIKTTV